jgi:PKD repeat protein
MGDGINRAQYEIEVNGRNDAVHVMIVLSDGKNNAGADPVQAANEAKSEGTIIYAIGLGDNADEFTLKQVATDVTHYYYAPNSGELAEIYEKISQEVSNFAGIDVTVTYELPIEFEYVPYSFSVPGNVAGNTARWNLGIIGIGEIWKVVFEVRSHECGDLPVNDVTYSGVIYTMPSGVLDSVPFQEWHVQVECPRLAEFTWSPQAPSEGGIVQFTDVTQVPAQSWITSWDWDFGDETPHSTEQNPSHAYADDGVYDVELAVTYDDGRTETATSEIDIVNVAPEVTLEALSVDVGIAFRIAGEKWHDVTVNFYEDGVVVEEGRLVRTPGSPNDQMLHLDTFQADISRTYSATVLYTPEDDPVNGQPNGANPCWMILDFGGGEEVWVHHTFNVKHPETYTWEVDITDEVLSHGLMFVGSIQDPGADTLTIHWEFGDGAVLDSVYDNAQGTFPVELIETTSHSFPGPGTYTVVLSVEDDEGGQGSASVEVTVQQ